MTKDIFQYFNGERAVCGDPLIILQKITLECDGDVNGVYTLTQSENAMQSIPAQWKLIEAARKAFGMLPPIDPESGAGATNEVVFAVLQSFWEWWRKKKQSTESKPTSDPPSDLSEAIRNYVVSGQTSTAADSSRLPSS